MESAVLTIEISIRSEETSIGPAFSNFFDTLLETDWIFVGPILGVPSTRDTRFVENADAIVDAPIG